MRHGAEQVQQGSRIVLIVHDLVGEEVAAGGGLRWESEMEKKGKEAIARLDGRDRLVTGISVREGSAWPVLASRTSESLVHPIPSL